MIGDTWIPRTRNGPTDNDAEWVVQHPEEALRIWERFQEARLRKAIGLPEEDKGYDLLHPFDSPPGGREGHQPTSEYLQNG